MPGPPPKPAATRQRANRTSTAGRFQTDEQPRTEAPDLGTPPDEDGWHPRVEEFWAQVWDSPMAGEFLNADLSGLYVLAALVDRFWKTPSTSLAAEIRLQRQCYGLTPIDRRRLQWEIVRGEEAERKAKGRRPKKPQGDDPRSALRVVS